jgi:dTDP-glucose pyrophosphorylase/predicted transcriptional regulator
VSLPESIWRKAVVKEAHKISEAISILNESALQIVLIVDQKMKLVGTLTDGDIRRKLLDGLDLEMTVATVMCSKMHTVSENTSVEEALRIMRRTRLGQLPIVDDLGRLVGLHVWDEEVTSTQKRLENIFFIMAGGLGKRLRPFTENCPKPLLPVAGKPILQWIIEKAKGEGFTKFVISVGYLGAMIEEYFGDGSDFSVDIEYLRETKPLGTAGALTLLKDLPTNPFIVTNGDVFSDLKYHDFIKYHQSSEALITMAVRRHELQHPFGVVEIDKQRVLSVSEKPVYDSYINAGIYVLEVEVLKELKPGVRCDMTSLIDKLIKNKSSVGAYPIHESWRDIGVRKDLEEIIEQIERQGSSKQKL